MTILREYVDRHISGKTDDRPAFQQLVADSATHTFDAVICWKTDRLARNRYDSAVYKKKPGTTVGDPLCRREQHLRCRGHHH